MPIPLSKIEEMAPDQASLAAASKLRKPGSWPVLASGGDLIWGECQGSGSTPYRVVCSEADLGYKCTCPSRKFPCKHTLALLWMRNDGKPAFTGGDAPDWVQDWLARRKPGGGAPNAGRPGIAVPGEKSAASALATEPEPESTDPKALARAAAARDRVRADREASIAGGLEELDLWIADALQFGLAGCLANLPARCRTITQRLVDAKAPGLAARLEALPAEIVALPDARRLDHLTESLASLHVIAEAYRRQDQLPPALREDVRQAVGWPVGRDALLADAAALRVRGDWMVAAISSEVQPDRLRRLETWLARLDDGPGPRFALLLDFVPVAVGAVALTYTPGEAIAAELVFYPGAAPLRALIADQSGAASRVARWPTPREDVPAAIAALHATRASRPWAQEMPFAASNAQLRSAGEALWLCDEAGSAGLPVRRDADGLAEPLIGLAPLDVFGRWDGASLTLDLAETPLGRWVGV